MPNQLPSGRWRARVRHPATGKQLSAHLVIGGEPTFPSERHARAAESQARDALASGARTGVTVGEFWRDWTTDPLWLRPAASTNLHNAERTRKFAAAYGERPLRSIDSAVVAEWLKGAGNKGTVSALRAFFNDARRPQAGRLIDHNPFANLGLRQSRGRRDVQPPGIADVARLVALADAHTPPSFAAYLLTAVYSGLRPGELDALKWTDLDFQSETIRVDRQWNAKVREFTPPKHGHCRTAAMTEPVRERLLTLPREGEFVFTTLRGDHYTASSRSHHWNRVRCLGGLPATDLYTATRHHFGWYAFNVLGLPAHVIAAQFGHRDGGKLVASNYGHPDALIARERIREAFSHAPPEPVPIAVSAAA